MLSQEARNSFDTLLSACLIESLKTPDTPDWVIEKNSSRELQGKEIIMLTISSYNFRLFLILHFSRDAVLNKYISKLLEVDPSKLGTQQFYDYLGEIGNGFCGSYKRELGRCFPFLGMSTPNLLESETLEHLKVWDYEYESHCLATLNKDIKLYGSVYISSYEDVNFKCNIKLMEENNDSGELELF